MTTLNEILSAAQALSSPQQAQLIVALWDNVAPSDWIAPDSQWIEEADRRSDAYDEGQMSAASWSEVRARARRKAGLDG